MHAAWRHPGRRVGQHETAAEPIENAQEGGVYLIVRRDLDYLPAGHVGQPLESRSVSNETSKCTVMNRPGTWDTPVTKSNPRGI